MAITNRHARTKTASDAYLDAANESVTLVLAILDRLRTGAEQQALDDSDWRLVRDLRRVNRRLRKIVALLGKSE